MILRALALAPLLALAPHAIHPRARPPAPPLPMLPVISRVHVQATRDHLLVVEDVNLERGEWTGGDLDLYVAFGAPGAPRAFDARLLSVAEDSSYATLDDAGVPVDVERAPRRPLSAQPLLGRAQMAGAVLHVDGDDLRKALEPGDMAVVRIRTLLDLPEKDAHGAREVVVRLGTSGGPPLALRRVELEAGEARGWMTRAEATLCGPDADGWPLSLHVEPALDEPARLDALPIAPGLSLRHATDDLCVRFWTDDDAPLRTRPPRPARR